MNARRKVDTRDSVRTRYHGPTNYRPSRISAFRDGWGGLKPQRIFISYDHELDSTDNHHAAAQAFAQKFLREGATISSPGLSFGGDTYWTWVMIQDHLKSERARIRRLYG